MILLSSMLLTMDCICSKPLYCHNYHPPFLQLVQLVAYPYCITSTKLFLIQLESFSHLPLHSCEILHSRYKQAQIVLSIRNLSVCLSMVRWYMQSIRMRNNIHSIPKPWLAHAFDMSMERKYFNR